MGGKAMKIMGIDTERKSTSEHLRIESIVTPIIQDMFKTEVKGVKFYRSKESHGDLDLLILNNGNLGNIGEKLKEKFGPVHCNGNVFSFEFEKYQVDIIPQPTRNWETCSDFFDYDPTGNLMGKIAHRFGLKYGFQGLVFPFRTFSGRLSTDIIISKDSKKIFEFLGYDYDRYLKGFDTVEEIFDWVIAGKYFSAKNFMMDELNHIDRKRNAKRATYQKFLEYINERADSLPTFQMNKDKSTYIDMIDEFFPEANFKKQLEELLLEDSNNRLVAEKFNGDLVMGWTGLKDKELGQCLNAFKEYITSSFPTITFKECIIATPYVDVLFNDWYSQYKKINI